MHASAPAIFPTLHGEEVPSESRAHLEKVKKSFGFIPNMFAAFSNSPVLLEGYLSLDAVYAKGTLSAAERQLVLLAASVSNECSYCAAAHSTVAKNMLKAPAAVVAAVRSGQPVPDAKLNALVDLTLEIVLLRGHATHATIESFRAAGYRSDQVGEVLIGVALKTISNYTDHLSPPELEAAFVGES